MIFASRLDQINPYDISGIEIRINALSGMHDHVELDRAIAFILNQRSESEAFLLIAARALWERSRYADSETGAQPDP